jgi:hypothetical protein
MPFRATITSLLVMLSVLCWSRSGWTETPQRMAQLRELYQSCVIDFVASNTRRNGVFQACSTEEQAILADAYAAGVSSVQANQVITGFKLSLKQTIRKILAEADKVPVPASTPPQTSTCGYRRYDGAWIALSCN